MARAALASPQLVLSSSDPGRSAAADHRLDVTTLLSSSSTVARLLSFAFLVEPSVVAARCHPFSDCHPFSGFVTSGQPSLLTSDLTTAEVTGHIRSILLHLHNTSPCRHLSGPITQAPRPSLGLFLDVTISSQSHRPSNYATHNRIVPPPSQRTHISPLPVNNH